MTELKFFPISEWHITNCKSEIDNRIVCVIAWKEIVLLKESE